MADVTYTANDTFICPAEVNLVLVEVWGGGGGGYTTLAAAGGRGGGGGAFSSSVLSVIGGNSSTITLSFHLDVDAGR